MTATAQRNERPADAPVIPDHLAGCRWVRGDDVLWREALDRVVILPPGSDEPLILTEPGGAVWDLLAEPRALEDVVATLAERYGETRERVAADLAPLLDELVRCGALKAAP